ncbi:MAG: hypothetical protein JXA30_14150, partial [Deltaproteobacteria bacterium]|nr:hypothetical protein [Deltaproteobacteria bacterium]
PDLTTLCACACCEPEIRPGDRGPIDAQGTIKPLARLASPRPGCGRREWRRAIGLRARILSVDIPLLALARAHRLDGGRRKWRGGAIGSHANLQTESLATFAPHDAPAERL